MSDEEKGFTIKDRRMFSEDSQEPQDSEDKLEKEVQPESTPEDTDAQQQTGASDDTPAEELPLPAVNFSTFVISLNASALVHLGAIEDPTTGGKIKNLPMAKQTIDMLSMLQEKTQGNLTTEEENILKSVLYDLRILYVKEKE